MSYPLISYWPRKSRSQDQSLWDEHVVLLTLQRNTQRPHSREGTGNNDPVYCTHMALNCPMTRAITSGPGCWVTFSRSVQYRGRALRRPAGLRVPGHTCTLINFSFRRTSEPLWVEQKVGERSWQMTTGVWIKILGFNPFSFWKWYLGTGFQLGTRTSENVTWSQGHSGLKDWIRGCQNEMSFYVFQTSMVRNTRFSCPLVVHCLDVNQTAELCLQIRRPW